MEPMAWSEVFKMLLGNLSIGFIVLEAIAIVYLFKLYIKAKDDCTAAYKEVLPAINELKKVLDIIVQLGSGD